MELYLFSPYMPSWHGQVQLYHYLLPHSIDKFTVNIFQTVIEFSPLYSFLALLNPGTHFSSPQAMFQPYGRVPQNRTTWLYEIQVVSRLVDITARGDFLALCDQKSSYKHVSDFGRLRSYDRLKLRIEGNDY